VDNSPPTALLAPLLAIIAGATDAIGFIGLGGLFSAHITGNLVVLAAAVVSHGGAPLAVVLSVPAFMIVVVLTRLLTAALQALGLDSLQPLLALQSLFLIGFLAFRVAAGTNGDPHAAIALLAGMLAVAAMAVQNALVQIRLQGTPPTAVMTTNVTRFALSLGQVLVGRGPERRQQARVSAQNTWPQIVGFLLGCGIGAACEAVFSSWSAVLPVSLAVLATGMSLNAARSARRHARQPSAGSIASSS
jgi:uncharacterized membrane protein YoaK (UPF0700 family)